MSAQQLQQIISPKFTEDVLVNIIKRKNALSDVKVNKIHLGAESKKGDSYLSNLCRFTIEASGVNTQGLQETVTIPVITKFLLKNTGRRKTFRSADFFENENIFYEKVWSTFQKFQEETNVSERFESIPLLLASHIDGQNDFISMLDLSEEGYVSIERGEGLDYKHTIAILQSLANFHALSLACKEQRPQEFEAAATSLKETYFSEKLRPWYSNFQKNVFVVIRDAIEKELPPQYLQRLNKVIDQDLYGLLIQSCVVRGPLSVVTHGDVWPPNFLVKYEGANPGRIKMIDFQLARYTTLATDLAFFLYSCVSAELVENKWDDLVAEYHRALVEGQRKYGAKNLVTLGDLNKELEEHSVMGVGMSMEALIMGQLDDDDVCDLDEIKGDEAVPLESVWIVRPFKQQEKRRRIACMVKMAVDRNFI